MEIIKLTIRRRTRPANPHALPPTDEQRIEGFRQLVELLRLSHIPIRYAFVVPEKDELVAYTRTEDVQAPLAFDNSLKDKSVTELIRDLVESLHRLLQDPDDLTIDGDGFLAGGCGLLGQAKLISWYQCLAVFGALRDDETAYSGHHYLPIDIWLGGTKHRIRLLNLPEIRARIKRLKEGKWPSVIAGLKIAKTVPDDQLGAQNDGYAMADSQSSDNVSGLARPLAEPGGLGGSKPGSCDQSRQMDTTIKVNENLCAIRGGDNNYYLLPQNIREVEPGDFIVCSQRPPPGKVYDLSARTVEVLKRPVTLLTDVEV